MAHIKKENLYNANTQINRIFDLRDFNSNIIVRVPVRTKAEADELLREGVTIYEKIVETPHGMIKHYYCQVLLSDLAKVAIK
jgi:hypothetical protein